jgi:hypothetical protein
VWAALFLSVRPPFTTIWQPVQSTNTHEEKAEIT